MGIFLFVCFVLFFGCCCCSFCSPGKALDIIILLSTVKEISSLSKVTLLNICCSIDKMAAKSPVKVGPAMVKTKREPEEAIGRRCGQLRE